MGKRKKRRGNPGIVGGTKAQPAAATAKALSPSLGGQMTGDDPGRRVRWVIFSLLSTVVVAVAFVVVFSDRPFSEWFEREKPLKGTRLPVTPQKTMEEVLEEMRKMPPQKKWEIDPWRPSSEDDKFIDRFVKLREKKDATANDLLAPAGTEAGPVSEDEAARRAAGAYLRDKGVSVIDVWRGDLDRAYKPTPVPRRYVLVTKGGAGLPPIGVRLRNGQVEQRNGGMASNQVVVVEFVPGPTPKIRPLRHEPNARP